MTYTQYLSRVMMAIFTTLLLSTAFIIYTDPFQIFHKSFIPGMGLIDNQRFQNAGLINSYLADPEGNYDSVMIGSSVSTNFTSETAATGLGWKKSLRLFMDGGDPSQLAQILTRAMNTKTVQHVLWELPTRSYSQPRYFLPINDFGFPDYLYNEKRFDDLRYVFNSDIFLLSWRYVIHRADRPEYTPETVGYWADSPLESIAHEKFNSPEMLLELQTTYANKKSSAAEEKNIDYAHFSYPVIDTVVLPILNKSCNTSTEFVLFIPPISKIDYMGNPMYVYRSIYMANYLANKIQGCRNIRLHAFDTMEFTGDLNNYIDKMHYRLTVSKKILDLMGQRQQVITVENFENYKSNFIFAVDNYVAHSSYPATADL